MYTVALSAEVPPQNLEAEEAVLGAMLLSETAIGTVTEILSAEDFYRGSHGTIYRTCLALWAKGEPVDAITLANELEERGELEQIGCEFKGFDAGLVDFHGRLEEREILWCWKFGEERITHWHELDAGFAGRQPLPEVLMRT